MRGQTVLPRDYDVFAGLDVDKRTLAVTFLNHHGLLRSVRMPYSLDHLLNHVRKHFGGGLRLRGRSDGLRVA
jgi:hypothetical protein